MLPVTVHNTNNSYVLCYNLYSNFKGKIIVQLLNPNGEIMGQILVPKKYVDQPCYKDFINIVKAKFRKECSIDFPKTWSHLNRTF